MSAEEPEWEPSGFTEEIAFPDAKPPDRLGRYELLALLGKGGMASVYLARLRGPSGFEKILAIKRIKDSLSEEKRFVEMFLDEARVGAALRHPNVAQVFELGHEGAVYFLAMEYLHGEHLGSVITRAHERGGRLPSGLAAWIGARVAEGLDHAHHATDSIGRPLALVHRDVSPQNIFVTYGGEVKLTDFGVAKASSNLVETDTGVVKGKFAYMAPEQAMGHAIDGRVDVFALGVVLWEALAGERLFAAATDARTLINVTRCEVPPLAEKRPDVDARLAAAVHRALAKDAADRFATAGAMASALSEACGGVVASGLRGWMTSHFAAEEERKRGFLTGADPASPEAPLGVSEPTAPERSATRPVTRDSEPPTLDYEDPRATAESAPLPLPASEPAPASLVSLESTSASIVTRRPGAVRLFAVLLLVAFFLLGAVFALFWLSNSPTPTVEPADPPALAEALGSPAESPAPVEPSAVEPASSEETPSAAPPPAAAPPPDALGADEQPPTEATLALEAAPVADAPPAAAPPPAPPSEPPPARPRAPAVAPAATGVLEISISPRHTAARYGWVQVGEQRRPLPAVIRQLPVGATQVRYQLGEGPERRVRVRVRAGRATQLQLR